VKATLVSLKATEDQINAGCPELTTEMLCAAGARYSRNDEGLDAILELMAGQSQDRAVDSIFRMVDYGHASISDMGPIPIFIDGISIWLAFYLWYVCPKAGGQETSTRYVKFGEGGILSPEEAGISDKDVPEWKEFIFRSIRHYQDATAYWSTIAELNPELARIPLADYEQSLIPGEEGHKARLKVERLKRNFVFDRARYFIPAAALTNVMMVMPARDWVELVKVLWSHYIPEAHSLAMELFQKLKLVIPRLTKHATISDDHVQGHFDEMKEDAEQVREYALSTEIEVEVDSNYILTGFGNVLSAFEHHNNRYARIGRKARQINVRYAITGVAMAELRDLNRHRTGYKVWSAAPIGFYAAEDQLPKELGEQYASVGMRSIFGSASALTQGKKLAGGDKSHPYWGLLGTKYYFEHGTTLDKMAYEIALRTGIGAHFRYAAHMREVHDKLIEKLPILRGKILVGTAEPE